MVVILMISQTFLEVVKMSTRRRCRPRRRYLFLLVAAAHGKERGEPFRSINVTQGRKNFNFLLTLYVLIAARSCLGVF